MSGETGEDQAYFRVIEETFIGLRGAPLLLSPADWQVAREWRRQGIPLGVVRRGLEEVFARRAERGQDRYVNSLRYCRRAVEAAWRLQRELTATGARGPGETIDATERLGRLAAALPAGLPHRDRLAGRIRGLTGAVDEVEEALAGLDAELLEAAERSLDPEGSDRVAAAVERALETVRRRLPEAAAPDDDTRVRLRRQAVRRELGLPVLSLFSPAAAGDPPG